MDAPKPCPPKGYLDAKIREMEIISAAEAVAALKSWVKKPAFVPKPHLTQRPFIAPELVSFRKGMQHHTQPNGRRGNS